MKKFLFTTLAVGALAVSANAALTVNSKGCYQISSASELSEFASVVNNGEKTACAAVTKSITLTGTWTPIMGFKGVFDGGYDRNDDAPITISGLKFDNSSSEVGLFGSAEGGALIRNVSIVNGSVGADKYVGGIVGNVVAASENVSDLKSVVIDNCNYSGSVKGNENAGGLVGNISSNTSVTITNSYSTATIEKYTSSKSDQGGLVGYVGANATLKLVNCYSTGSATTNPLVGNSRGTITGDNVGCKKTGTLFDKCDDVVKSGVYSNSNSANVVANYESNLNNEDYQIANVRSTYDASAIETMLAPDLSGISFKDTTWTEGSLWRKKTYAITSSTLNDTEPVVLPQSLTIDSVVLDREFQPKVNSTVMLPFSIAANAVEGGKFFNITAMGETDGVWNVTGDQEVTTIKAHTPYLVKPTANRLIFRGKVTLEATDGSMNEVAIDGADNWSFRGVYATKLWEENDPEIGTAGQAYGYSSKADADRGITEGSFVRVGKNVRLKPMRGYLYYAVPRCSGLCKSAAISLDDLPSTIVVNLIEKDLPPYIPEVEEVVETINPIVGEETEEQEDAPLSIVKPMIAPEAVKANRWFDLNGRFLNKKPTNHGSFYNKPVIIK
ncbi:MAG: hypothetical protein MJZ25_03225 [Fibrobacter sp.]|nr:hypothetical protein [Fibrobacter sp.]